MISMIVPTLGRATLGRLLVSIENAVHGSNLQLGSDVEVIVSVDGQDALSLQMPTWARAVTSPGAGVNCARNHGARSSRGDILWFLDDDTELLSGAGFLAIQKAFEDSSLAAIGGHYVSSMDAAFIETGYNAFCSLWRASAGRLDQELLLGGTLAVRREAWLAAGGFDEEIHYGGSETAFVQRLGAIAKVRFDEALNVRHFPGRRNLKTWAQVASLQGQRKTETASRLPGIPLRVQRAAGFLKRQNVKTLAALAVFSVPFLAVSKLARVYPSRA